MPLYDYWLTDDESDTLAQYPIHLEFSAANGRHTYPARAAWEFLGTWSRRMEDDLEMLQHDYLEELIDGPVRDFMRFGETFGITSLYDSLSDLSETPYEELWVTHNCALIDELTVKLYAQYELYDPANYEHGGRWNIWDRLNRALADTRDRLELLLARSTASEIDYPTAPPDPIERTHTTGSEVKTLAKISITQLPSAWNNLERPQINDRAKMRRIWKRAEEIELLDAEGKYRERNKCGRNKKAMLRAVLEVMSEENSIDHWGAEKN